MVFQFCGHFYKFENFNKQFVLQFHATFLHLLQFDVQIIIPRIFHELHD